MPLSNGEHLDILTLLLLLSGVIKRVQEQFSTSVVDEQR